MCFLQVHKSHLQMSSTPSVLFTYIFQSTLDHSLVFHVSSTSLTALLFNLFLIPIPPFSFIKFTNKGQNSLFFL